MSDELIRVLAIALPKMATVAAIWGTPPDVKDFLQMKALLEKLQAEKKK